LASDDSDISAAFRLLFAINVRCSVPMSIPIDSIV
jgi:hypothetical protein